MLNDPHADFKAAAQAIRESIAELSQRIDHLLVLGGEVKQLALKRLPSGQIVGRCEVGTYGELLTDPDDRCNTVLNWTVPAGVSIPAHSHAQCESTYILTGELYDAESGTIYRAGELMQLVAGQVHTLSAGDKDVDLLVIFTGPHPLDIS